MTEKDPNSGLERAVGKLEGVVDKLSDMVEKIWNIMDSKIDDKQGALIAQNAVKEHESRLHKNKSTGFALSEKNKQLLINAIVLVLTALATYLTAKFGI